MKITKCLLIGLIVCVTSITAYPQLQKLSNYNVIWESPSKDPTGQMPLGNGDIAAGVYAIEDGDLYLLLSKNDAFTYKGDIFKLVVFEFHSTQIHL